MKHTPRKPGFHLSIDSVSLGKFLYAINRPESIASLRLSAIDRPDRSDHSLWLPALGVFWADRQPDGPPDGLVQPDAGPNQTVRCLIPNIVEHTCRSQSVALIVGC